MKKIKCPVSRKRQRNIYNFANTIKSRHKYKILPAASQEFYNVKGNCRDMYCGFAVNEKTIWVTPIPRLPTP